MALPARRSGALRSWMSRGGARQSKPRSDDNRMAWVRLAARFRRLDQEVDEILRFPLPGFRLRPAGYAVTSRRTGLTQDDRCVMGRTTEGCCWSTKVTRPVSSSMTRRGSSTERCSTRETSSRFRSPPTKCSIGPESARHAIFGPQHVGEYQRYAPTCCSPNLTHLTTSGLDVIL